MTTTILASLMADGTGIPPVWRTTEDGGPYMVGGDDVQPGQRLDLDDPTTYREALATLAAWTGTTRLGPWFLCWDYDGHVCLMSTAGWDEPATVWRYPVKHVRGLAEILTHIAHDHRLRRGLGLDVQPGTLGVLEADMFDRWWFTVGDEEDDEAYAIKLPGITDPADALEAWAAEVTP